MSLPDLIDASAEDAAAFVETLTEQDRHRLLAEIADHDSPERYIALYHALCAAIQLAELASR